jgi:aspartate-semialdehyde dehydrogenase
MAIAVGSIVCNGDHHVEFEAYSHNTLRGAAGGVVLLAELACDRGLV